MRCFGRSSRLPPFLLNKTTSGFFHKEGLTGSNAVLTANNTTTAMIPERKFGY